MVRMRLGHWYLLAVLWSLATAVSVGPNTARAESETATPGASGWSFTVAPYLWLAGLEGDIGVGGLPPAEVDASFHDIIEQTDFALMMAAEARRDRWGILLDIVYLGLSQDAETPGPLFGDASVDVTTAFATIGGAYRAIDRESTDLDAIAGARLWYLDSELDLDAGLLPGRTGEGSESWVDPVVGFRITHHLGRGFFLTTLADVGGFEVGSDITWEAWGTLGYEAKNWLSFHAGYRHMKVDYKSGGFEFDVKISGPILGVVIRL